MKKLIALVLALAMVLMAASALAANITIEKTNVGQTYDIYKLFDAIVDSARTDGGAGISYKLRTGVSDFKATVNGSEVDGATSWFELDSAGNVKAKSGLNEDMLKSENFKAWAKAYGQKLTDKTITGDGNDQTISGLTDGYYFITTTTGTLVTIDSIGPDETVQDKNPPTNIDKEITGVVNDEGSVTSDREAAIAQVGAVVNFEVRIPIANGAVNYRFEDKMSHGLTLGNTVTVKLETAAVGETPASLSDAIAVSTYADGTPTMTNNATDGELDIYIAFKNSWLADNVGKTIVINYTGTVNNTAVIASANPNEATIKWGDISNPLTDTDTVNVYPARITVTKEDGTGAALEGAGFILKNSSNLYYKNTNGVISWVAESEATVVRPVRATNAQTGEKEGDAVASFEGLPDGSYILIEKEVPTGYNKAADTTWTIKPATAVDPADVNNLSTDLTLTPTVTNNQGTELPSTGGIGTTIFYILGGLLVVGAAVILVARRRVHE